MNRQHFDIGDIVKVSLPSAKERDSYGTITQKKLINANLMEPHLYLWHVDEYHCKISFPDGEHSWVRAKYLKMVSKAKISY